MLILSSALDWVQSFQGITTLSLGGISISGIVGFIIFAVKSGSQMRSVSDVANMVKEAQKMLTEERAKTALFKEQVDKNQLELAKRSDIENLLLKGMMTVIAASNGIDTVTKIDMINDMKNLQKSLTEEVKKEVQETVKTVQETLKENTTQVLNTTITQAATLVDKYSKK